jgi:hypothetical protein
MKRVTLILFLAAAPLVGQQPRAVNTKMETRAASTLERDWKAVAARGGAAWIGYAVPAVKDSGSSCCSMTADGTVMSYGCNLESGNRVEGTAAPGPIPLEGSQYRMILLRVENNAIGKVRAFSLDCPLDAGGLPFVWLTGVKPAESLTLLGSLTDGERRVADGAVMAIAMHEGAEADRLLERLAVSGPTDHVQEQAVFWMGAARGASGVDVLQRVMKSNASDRLREKAVFALSITKDPRGLTTLLASAKGDASARVRQQALFWLAQKASKKAVGALRDAIENDPDTQVKRHAVFALTQLPKDEGVPLLIQVAKTNRNAAVRKQAFFWLGQSKDPRALEFLEQVLTH